MYCIKCGNVTENDQIFCTHCLQVMEQYPVKPGATIQLPRRASAQAPKKQSRRRSLPPEEQVVHMRVTIRTLVAILGAALIALGISLWLNLSSHSANAEPSEPPLGQNYTVYDTTD